MVRLPDLSPESAGGTGAFVAVGTLRHRYWYGSGRVSAAGPPVDARTLWDLASLTKVLITTPLVIRAVAAGSLKSATTVGAVVSSYVNHPVGQATVEQLLTHTSGAPPEFMPSSDVDAGLRDLAMLEPGHVVYSDAGFIALGRILEVALGASLDDLARQHLRECGVDDGEFAFVAADPQRWADTGVAEPGRVHDPAASAAGRLLGHAGCFATVGAACRLTEWWLARTDPKQPLIERAVSVPTTPGSGGMRGWGWALQGDDYSCSRSWPDSTVSHTGFTGTAVAVDRAGGRYALLLSNAVSQQGGQSISWIRSVVDALASEPNPDEIEGSV